jgi:hypothetical protein
MGLRYQLGCHGLYTLETAIIAFVYMINRKPISIAASIFWLLLIVVDCNAMVATPAGAAPANMPVVSAEMPAEMDCCDPVELTCCEPTSSAISYIFDAGENDVIHVAALQSTWPTIIANSSIESRTVAADWRRYTRLRRLHLLNCSFLD